MAPAQIVFSGFTWATLWLVLGGLILAEAVHRTGLAQRIAGALFDRYTRSYRQLIAAVVIVSIALSFFMPRIGVMPFAAFNMSWPIFLPWSSLMARPFSKLLRPGSGCCRFLSEPLGA